VIAALAGLGTINHTALTVEAALGSGLRLIGVVLVDAAGDEPAFVAENAAQIADQCGVPVLGVLPHLDDATDIDALADAAGALDLSALTAPRPDASEAVVAATGAISGTPSPRPATGGGGTARHPLRGRQLAPRRGRSPLPRRDQQPLVHVHGHAHPALDRAAREQLGRIAHSTFWARPTHQEPCSPRSSPSGSSGLTRVFYCEAGAAAVEAALRIALLAQRHAGHPSAPASWPSATRTTATPRGRSAWVAASPSTPGSTHPLPGPHRAQPPSRRGGVAPGALRPARPRGRPGGRPDRRAARPGRSGMLTHSDRWLAEAAALARRHGALLIADEVATGFGRTGDLFASGGAGVAPDILCLGKG